VRVSVTGETSWIACIAWSNRPSGRRRPTRIALNILLVALTLVFLASCHVAAVLHVSVEVSKLGSPVTSRRSSRSCLSDPTTIGGLLSAIGVAGWPDAPGECHRHFGRAVEAAGDVDVLLLDKTGTSRWVTVRRWRFCQHWGQRAGAGRCRPARSLADETPEGRSIVVLAKKRFNMRERDLQALGATFVAFSAHTRMSGVNIGDRQIRKGPRCDRQHVEKLGGSFHSRPPMKCSALPERQYTVVLLTCPCPGRSGAEGHRQGRHQGAVRRSAADGNQTS